MGAKLSKKKKGYCLGAGKDGESTDTTEVEQKETETQAGQKDAAEPNGEKNPTDQTLNNGASEEQKTQAEKTNPEVRSGDSTKDDLNKDQKSESKTSAEQKVEEPNKEQDKSKPAKSSNTSQQMARESGKEVSQPDKKTQTDHKEKESVAKEEPTQEPKPATEQNSEPKQPNQSVIEPSAPALEQKEVSKSIPDPEIKAKVEKMEKEQKPVLTTERVSVHVTKPTVQESMKGPEKIPEIVETLVSETASVEPLWQETVTAPVSEKVEPEPVNKVAETKLVEPDTTETVQATEVVKPELAPVTESALVIKEVESKAPAPEESTAPVPEIKNVEPVANPELAPCAEPDHLSETKQGTESLPEPMPSNEVPDSTAQVKENVKNSKTSGDTDLVTEMVETQAATTESAPTAKNKPDQDATIAENCTSEQAVDGSQECKAQDAISKEQEVEDEEVQKVKEERVLANQPTEHGSLEEDCKGTEEIALDTSKNEGDQVASEDATDHSSEDKNSEDKAENHEMPAEERSKEPSAPLIVDKYGVGNGLPVKEEVKVHLENGCDKELHELNGQSECREIEVCNE